MAFYRIHEIDVQEKKDNYYVYQGREEVEIELNSGYSISRDILEYIHFLSNRQPITIILLYRDERLHYLLQTEDEELMEPLQQWVPRCRWAKEKFALDTSFAKEKIVLRGSASPLVLKDRDENLLDELIRALPRETFLIQLKLGFAHSEKVAQQVGVLEQTINDMAQKASVQIGEQSHLGGHLKKMLTGGENLSYEQKNISVQKQMDVLENHLYSLNSQGAIFSASEFVVYAAKGTASLIASKMEAFSRRSGSQSLYRLRRDHTSPVEFLNYASSHHLAALIALPMNPVPGVKQNRKIIFGADTGESSGKDVSLGGLIVTHETQVPVMIPLSALSKHTFISGVTGSGKTSTVKSVLTQIDRENIPFLVIEPAKSEYRYLDSAIPSLKRYVLGIEGALSFKINPFEFPEHIHVQTHMDHLKSVFVAAFPMYGPMPYILETAFYEIYRRTGWDFVSGRNIYDSQLSREKLFPTLEDLHAAIDGAIEVIGYSTELASDIRGALKVRIGSLLSGAKGSMLNCRKGNSIQEVMRTPSIIELECVGDDQEKVFLMGLLLISIYEHYISEGQHSSSLKHLLVIEEAHRLLENVKASGNQETADMKGKAVETFNNMLSEIRTYGQGFVIADQIPNKLSPDVIKNTNLKIVHRLFAKDDRQVIGDSIGLEEEEIDELIRLKQGEAVIFHGDIDYPVKVKVDVDLRTLASNRKSGERLEMKSFALEDYLLQQEPFLADCYRLLNTGLLFPELQEVLEHKIAEYAYRSFEQDIGGIDRSSWYIKLSERYLKTQRYAEQMSHVNLYRLLDEISEDADPLASLINRAPHFIRKGSGKHPMQRLSRIYSMYSRLHFLCPVQLDRLLAFISSQTRKVDGENLLLIDQLLKNAGLHRYLEMSILNAEQRKQLCYSMLLVELPDQYEFLEVFFNVRELNPIPLDLPIS